MAGWWRGLALVMLVLCSVSLAAASDVDGLQELNQDFGSRKLLQALTPPVPAPVPPTTPAPVPPTPAPVTPTRAPGPAPVRAPAPAPVVPPAPPTPGTLSITPSFACCTPMWVEYYASCSSTFSIVQMCHH
ncbi:hypothetical protein KC19_9G034600 [Ceratodon purpureus]|uniref:Uncharacterized protein n=1 Tax=Ceratodon purpureus TaxID=3225 RepID=A0A8T0GNC6_CERPU|nr:hypothetical protein KC19_9G034600 [Ceratodon purpureus]